VGQVGDLEIDFVVEGPEGARYIQVAETVRDEATLAREISALQAVRDNYPKVLLTLDDVEPVSHGGIVQMNALDWFLGKGEGL